MRDGVFPTDKATKVNKAYHFLFLLIFFFVSNTILSLELIVFSSHLPSELDWISFIDLNNSVLFIAFSKICLWFVIMFDVADFCVCMVTERIQLIFFRILFRWRRAKLTMKRPWSNLIFYYPTITRNHTNLHWLRVKMLQTARRIHAKPLTSF